jgi:hypothetical protein
MTIALIAAATVCCAGTLLWWAFRNAPLLDESLADFDEHVRTVPIPIIDERADEAVFAARWHEIVTGYGTRGSSA